MSWHRPTAILLAILLLAAGLGGCRPRAPEPLSLSDTVGRLNWSLAADPAGPDTYRLTLTNPGAAALATPNLLAYLVASVGEAPSFPESQPVPLPQQMPAGATETLSINFPARALWPGSFTVSAFVRPVAGSEAPVRVAEGVFSPGAISLTFVWPDAGYADFPPGDYFLFRFDPPVTAEALRASLSIEPEVAVEVRPDTNQDPAVLEVHPAARLAPYTLYTVTVDHRLAAAGGSVTMGRDRALVFSTGARDYRSLGAPAWSPDGARVAWTAAGSSGIDLYVGDVSTMSGQAKVADVQGGTPAWSSGPGAGRYLYFAGLDGGNPNVSRLDLQTGTVDVVVDSARLREPARLELAASPAGDGLAIEADYGGVDAHSDLIKTVYLYLPGSGTLTQLPARGLTSRLVGWRGSEPLYAATYQNFDNSHHFRYNLYGYDSAAAAEATLLGAGELENVGGFSVAAGTPAAVYWTWEAQDLGVTIVHRPADLWLVWGLDESAVPAPTRLTSAGRYRDAALSPDATIVAAAEVRGGSWDLVIIDTDDGSEGVVATGPAAQFAPAWSPDGSRLAYVEAAGSTWSVAVLDPMTGAVSSFKVVP